MLQSNIPIPLTSLVGREKEVDEVVRLLSTTRLLTLTGAGGVGKTRLAMEVARTILRKFSDGGCWVDLAPLKDASLIPQTIAKALDIYLAPNQPALETITNYLQSKQLLLVLDNCEHLIASIANLIEHLLSVCPDLHVLITSREELSIFGEVTWHVPSLPFPDLQSLSHPKNLLEYSSIQLFIERAAAVTPGYSLSDLNTQPIVLICQKLDGIPLAIELAAARTKLFSAKEIAARLIDRFDILTGGSRNALPRQQTLRATLDWSYELLTEPEQNLFRCLSIFAGCFSLEAAEQIACPNPPVEEPSNFLNLLVQLVNKSLINVETEPSGSDLGTRYSMLETIREYAGEKLAAAGDAGAVSTSYLNYYLRLAEKAEPKIYTQEQKAWLNRLEAEHDNLRSALELTIKAGDIDSAARLALLSIRFLQRRGYFGEAAIWLDRILAMSGKTDQLQAQLLLERGRVAMINGAYEQAIEFIEASLSFFRGQGNISGIAQGIEALGIVNVFQGKREVGVKLLEESLETFRRIGDRWQEAHALLYISDSYNRMGNTNQAAMACQECLSLFNSLGDPWGIEFASGSAGEIARRQGDLKQAKQYFRTSLLFQWQNGYKGDFAYTLETLALIAISEKDFERAVRLWGAAEAERERFNAPLPLAYESDYRQYLTLARNHIGEKTYNALILKGRELSPEAFIALATQDGLHQVEASSITAAEPASDFHLTKRETEILRLVASGMTDSQVAEQLFLSPRTIGKHLQSIYGKLHVNSRTAAAHFALEQKLIEQ